MMKLKKKPSPSTTKRNQLRIKKFIDMKKASVMNTSSNVDVNDSQDVTLAQKDDLSESTLKCDQCDFHTRTSRGLKMHVSKQHKISQLDGEDEVLENKVSDKDVKCECIEAKCGYSELTGKLALVKQKRTCTYCADRS